jgi:hypothetical protein
VDGDRTGGYAALAEEACCALVRERAVVRGHVLVDRRADERVNERGTCQPQRIAGEPPEANQDGARDRSRTEVGHRGDMAGVRRHALHVHRADQLPEQKRVTAGRRMTRRRERLVGALAQPLADEPGRRLVAERSGT